MASDRQWNPYIIVREPMRYGLCCEKCVESLNARSRKLADSWLELCSAAYNAGTPSYYVLQGVNDQEMIINELEMEEYVYYTDDHPFLGVTIKGFKGDQYCVNAHREDEKL